MPRFILRGPGVPPWVPAALALGLILGLRLTGFPLSIVFPVFLFGLWFPAFFAHKGFLLMPGALWVLSIWTGPQAIPLALARWERTGAGWALTWAEGKRQRQTQIPDAQGRFLAEIPNGGLKEWPQSEAEVSGAYPIGYVQGGLWFALLAGVLMLGGHTLGFVLQEPLFYLLLLPLPWLARQAAWRRFVSWDTERLWVLDDAKEPHPIPLSQVKGMAQGFLVTRVSTFDPAYPTLRLDGSRSAELIRRLERHLKEHGA